MRRRVRPAFCTAGARNTGTAVADRLDAGHRGAAGGERAQQQEPGQ